MVREPLEPAITPAAEEVADPSFVPPPPPIRRDDELPAVTGEISYQDTAPNVPQFPSSGQKAEAAQPTPSRRRFRKQSRDTGTVSTRTSGGTVVTFPPQNAPGSGPGEIGRITSSLPTVVPGSTPPAADGAPGALVDPSELVQPPPPPAPPAPAGPAMERAGFLVAPAPEGRVADTGMAAGPWLLIDPEEIGDSDDRDTKTGRSAKDDRKTDDGSSRADVSDLDTDADADRDVDLAGEVDADLDADVDLASPVDDQAKAEAIEPAAEAEQEDDQYRQADLEYLFAARTIDVGPIDLNAAHGVAEPITQPEEPADSETAASADIPQLLDAPEVLPAPIAPQVTATPEVPPLLDAPEVPVTADAPLLFDAPEAPEVPQLLDAPPLPDTRHLPGALQVPKALQISNLPQAPDALEAPDAPVVPSAPKAPDAPQLKDAPEVKDGPEVKDAPEAKDGPEAPNAPEAPDAPEVKDAPQAPEVEAASIVPAAAVARPLVDTPEADFDATDDLDDLLAELSAAMVPTDFSTKPPVELEPAPEPQPRVEPQPDLESPEAESVLEPSPVQPKGLADVTVPSAEVVDRSAALDRKPDHPSKLEQPGDAAIQAFASPSADDLVPDPLPSGASPQVEAESAPEVDAAAHSETMVAAEQSETIAPEPTADTSAPEPTVDTSAPEPIAGTSSPEPTAETSAPSSGILLDAPPPLDEARTPSWIPEKTEAEVFASVTSPLPARTRRGDHRLVTPAVPSDGWTPSADGPPTPNLVEDAPLPKLESPPGQRFKRVLIMVHVLALVGVGLYLALDNLYL